MNLFEFYINLRSDILKQISGVEDSNGYDSWDNTTPNYIIKVRLNELLKKYLSEAEAFGVYTQTRCMGCSNPAHYDLAPSHGAIYWPILNKNGVEIQLSGKTYGVIGDLFNDKRISTCICSPENKPSLNYMADSIIYLKSPNSEDSKTIASILLYISIAIELSADKKPRSGIREYLLKVVLSLNDAILPMPINDYIAIVTHKNNRVD